MLSSRPRLRICTGCESMPQGHAPLPPWRQYQVACRYVWLPMWIEEVPPDVLAKAQAEWEAARQDHLRNGGSMWYTLPPGPLHIVVPWFDSWSPSVLNGPLDPEIKRKHWEELRTYPLANQAMVARSNVL